VSGVVAAGCAGKQPFASRDQALMVLKRTYQHLTFFGHYAMVWM
jgi:hypothetical protein